MTQENRELMQFIKYYKKVYGDLPVRKSGFKFKVYNELYNVFLAGFNAGREAQREDLSIAFFSGLHSCKESKKEQR